MSNLLVAIAVFLITVVGALFAVPYFVDWNSYRGVFEEEASRIVGREVRVGGEVNAAPAADPLFPLREGAHRRHLRQPQEPFFRADSLSIKLSIPPMFRGIVEANEIEFQRPDPAPGARRQGWLELAELRAGAGPAAYMPTNVDADLAQDHRRRAGRARPRRQRAGAPRRLERRAVGAGARRPLSLPRHVRRRRGRARDQAGNGHARGRRRRALQGVPAPGRHRGQLHAGRARVST